MLSKLKLMKLSHFKHPIKNTKNFLFSKPNRFDMLADIYKKFVSVPDPDKWVFIIGCYNSGTTLLQRLLNEQKEISTIYEGVFKTNELNTPEELGWTRLWYKVTDQVRLTAKDTSINIDDLKKDWGIFLDNSKSVFVEKSIVNSTRMTWLRENFENSYFIHIVRNGYAVAEGIKRKAPKGAWGIQKNEYKPTYPIEFCAKQWVASNEIVEKDSKKIKKFKKVSYEELCKSPKKTLKDLLKFLEIDEGINWSKNKKWNIHEKKGKIRNMNPKSINNLTSTEIKKINDIARNMLKFYNYKIL